MKKMIVQWIVTFVLRQLGKYMDSTDFSLVRKDLEARLRDFIPREAFDNFSVDLMNRVLDFIIYVITSDLQDDIVHAVSTGEIKVAFDIIMRELRKKFKL